MNRDRADFPRRDFLKRAGAAGCIAWLHAGCQRFEPARVDPPPTEKSPTNVTSAVARITALQLQCAAPLEEMRRFYHASIGLSVVAEAGNRIAFRAGETLIIFEQTEVASAEAPFYHFAFNVPENKIRAARDWQAARCTLIETPPELRDPRYPDDVRWFRHWNAHSVFFWDPAGNLVEYIARHDLPTAKRGNLMSRTFSTRAKSGLSSMTPCAKKPPRCWPASLTFEVIRRPLPATLRSVMTAA